jgi:hypothetical protein
MKRLLLVLFLSAPLASQSTPAVQPSYPASGFKWSMEFEREGLTVPWWKIERGPDGATVFSARRQDALPVPTSTFTMSAATSTRLESLLRSSHAMQPCETKAKNLANMGLKTLTFTADGTSAKCAFNYSDNRPLLQIADIGQAIAFTQESGAELARLHRYDRLGLDKEMINLSKAAAEGTALELQSIAETLRSIAADPHVLDRVRAKAVALLELASN